MPDGGAPGRIVVVGDLLVDVVVRPSGPLRVGSDTAAEVRVGGGGSAANTAAWLAHQMAPVALLAAIGPDAHGAAAAADLEALGVTHLGPVRPAARTGTCVVIVGADSERTMLPDRGANDDLPVEAAVAAVAADDGWLHVSGYALLHEGSRPAGRAALDRAVALGVPTSVDAASSGPLRDLGPAAALDLLAGVDLVLANADEVAALGGTDAVLERVGAVVVKRGAAGATWTDGTARHDVPAAPTRVVDTTGAGDALAAGYLARTRMGAPPAEALAAGAALAAHAVAHLGARPRVR